MIKKQIIFKSYKNLIIRVWEDTEENNIYDVTFTQAVWPHWRIRHKNKDLLSMKELVHIYSIRAFIMQWLSPRFTYWLVMRKKI